MKRSFRSTCEFLTFDNIKVLFKLNICKASGQESKQNTNEEVVKFLLIQQSQLLYLRNSPTLYFLGEDGKLLLLLATTIFVITTNYNDIARIFRLCPQLTLTLS